MRVKLLPLLSSQRDNDTLQNKRQLTTAKKAFTLSKCLSNLKLCTQPPKLDGSTRTKNQKKKKEKKKRERERECVCVLQCSCYYQKDKREASLEG